MWWRGRGGGKKERQGKKYTETEMETVRHRPIETTGTDWGEGGQGGDARERNILRERWRLGDTHRSKRTKTGEK